MATIKRFYVDIDLTGRQIIHASFQQLASDPISDLTTGRMYYNTDLDVIRYYDGTAWLTLATGGNFDDLLSSISELEASITILNSDVSDIVSTITVIEGDLSDVSTSLITIDSTISDISTSQVSISALQSDISTSLVTLEGEVGDISTSLSTIDSTITDISTSQISISTLQSDISTSLVTLEGEVSDISTSLTSLESDTSLSIASIVTQISDLDVGQLSSELSDISTSQVSISETLSDTILSVTDNETSITSIITVLENADSDTIPSIINELSDINTSLSSIDSGIDTHISDTLNPHSTTLSQVVAAGSNAGGEINMDGNKITNLGEPDDNTDAATKLYVDQIAQGLKVRDKVQIATTTNLNATAAGSQEGKTLTNAGTQEALVIDGYSVSVDDRVLVKDQSQPIDNGIYTVTVVGNGSTNWVLTRTGEFDDSPDTELSAGDYFFVQFGSANASTGWVLRPIGISGDPVVDSDPLNFIQFSAAGSYLAGGGIDIDGNIISLDAEDAAGTGLEAEDSTTLAVIGYTPVTDATVARKRTFTSVSIVAGTPQVLTHNLATQAINVSVLDQADYEEVVVNVRANSTTQVTIESAISFTATVVVIG